MTGSLRLDEDTIFQVARKITDNTQSTGNCAAQFHRRNADFFLRRT